MDIRHQISPRGPLLVALIAFFTSAPGAGAQASPPSPPVAHSATELAGAGRAEPGGRQAFGSSGGESAEHAADTAGLAQRRVPRVVAEGDIVRLFAGREELVTGTLVGIRGDSIVVVQIAGIDTVHTAIARVSQALVLHGKRRRGWRAVGTGTLVGAAVGATILAFAVLTAEPRDEGMGILVALYSGLGGSVATGFTVGAIRSQRSFDRWIPFDPATLRVADPEPAR